jgi:putative intracellular protease/amidase
VTRRVLDPLPDRDFDVTEVAVPWRLLTDAGHEVVFATETGCTPHDAATFVVTDGRYVSSRWPGDAYAFGSQLAHLLR